MPENERIKEIYLCPRCGEPLEDDMECSKAMCGWKVGDRSPEPQKPSIPDDELREIVFAFIEEKIICGVPFDDVTSPMILEELELDIPMHKMIRIRKSFKEIREREARRAQYQNNYPQQQQNYPQQNPQQNFLSNSPNIPDWILAPYKMQIENLKEDRDRQVGALREERERMRLQIAELQKELREEVKRPQQKDPKWEELDKLAFERLKSDIVTGRNSPKSWMEELVSGLVSSGQLGTIATEAGALLSDLRNRGNPNHDPYAQFNQQQPQPQPRPQPRPQQQQRVPPANIKRVATAKRNAPPTPPAEPVEIIQPVERPRAEIIQPEEIQQEEEPLPEQMSPSQEVIELDEEDMELYNSFVEKYHDIAVDTVPLLLKTIVEENPEATRNQKVEIIIKTLRVVAQLRLIGVGVKGLILGTYNVDTAATYLISRDPEAAHLLAETGAERWLEYARLFADHPVHGKDVQFLRLPEARKAIDEVIAELRRRYGM